MKWTEALMATGIYYYGKRKNCRLAVHYNSMWKTYFFAIDVPNGKTYISTRDNLTFQNIEEAQVAAEQWVDENIKKAR